MPEGKINVLVIRPPTDAAGDWGPLEDKYLREIKEVSPRINVQEASLLSHAAKKGDTAARKKLDSLLADTEIIYGFPGPQGISLKDIMARAPRLKWMQCPVSGVDMYGIPEFINSNVILTNSSGMHGTQVGEIAFLHMIMLAKNAPKIFSLIRAKRHDVFIPIVLEGKTVCVLGLGPIGKHVAKISKGFGMRVIGVEANPKVKCRYCEAIYLSDKMNQAFSQADFVVDCLPLLAATKHIINERALRAMKPTAFFINIGRGGTVDQEALIRALKNRTIAGAGLDAQDPEPLPPDNELWNLPNVTLTPHVGGRREDYHKLAVALFTKNLNLYVAGKKLFNIIDKKTLAKPAA